MSTIVHSENEALVASLGQESLDAFYLACALNSIDSIKYLTNQGRPQDQLDAGLKAAYTACQPDVAKYLADQGADIQSLVATIGADEARDYFQKGLQMLTHTHAAAIPVRVVASWSSEREHHNLRLRWASLGSTNLTVRTAIEGFDPPQPSILRQQALHTSMPPDQRLAWMRFDLGRTAKANINQYASITNVEGTPLHWAVDERGEPWKNRKVLEFLLVQGADPCIKNHEGQTPLEYVRGMLALPNDSLHPKWRDFYGFASERLYQAERSITFTANRPANINVWARLKNTMGYWQS